VKQDLLSAIVPKGSLTEYPLELDYLLMEVANIGSRKVIEAQGGYFLERLESSKATKHYLITSMLEGGQTE
jgi:hypothetical protein